MASEARLMGTSAQAEYAGILESFGRSADSGVQSVLDVHRLLLAGIEGTAIRRFAAYYNLSNDDLTQ